jgi:hypothetical protein
VPGTLRDSLVLLAVVLEQQTELQPTEIMTEHHVEPNEEKVSTIQKWLTSAPFVAQVCYATKERGARVIARDAVASGECWTVRRLTSYTRLASCNA